MNRIDKLFADKPKSILSVYFTAGYPKAGDTVDVIGGLESAGADLIEIGFPFSDPVADGPVIQASSHQALVNGMNLDLLFNQLNPIKKTSSIPKILMGYFNTVYRYGVEKFIEQCVACAISGVIIPDLPAEVYVREYQSKFESAGIHFIFLIAPQTPPERAEYLASLSRGFLYLLSSSSTTGSNYSPVREGLSSLPTSQGISTLPSLVGFGIHDQKTFKHACGLANGAIIGTAFVRLLGGIDSRLTGENRHKEIHLICKQFVNQIRG